jgi:hypothetical protein
MLRLRFLMQDDVSLPFLCPVNSCVQEARNATYSTLGFSEAIVGCSDCAGRRDVFLFRCFGGR